MGKCVTLSGADPKHKYYSWKSKDCEKLCRDNEDCYGYSASTSNCLLWLEPIKGGGATWGNAHCMQIRVPDEVNDGAAEGGGEKKNTKEKKKKKKGGKNKKDRKNKKGKKNKKGRLLLSTLLGTEPSQ